MKKKISVTSLLVSGLLMSSALLADAKYLPDAVTDTDYRTHSQEQVELGRNLFFDKILSGNMNISCATCHHALTDTGDGLSLPIGEGGRGLGVTRDTGSGPDAVPERVPRNAPPVFNLGAHEFERMFHDGRVAVDPAQPSGFISPAGNDLPLNLENVLAAQAMFPVTSGTEMAGQAGENPIANAAAAGDLASSAGVWAQLAARLKGIPGYVTMFVAAYNDISSASDITFAHAANAIAAFEAVNWRADNSPFDRYLRRDKQAMSKSARLGMQLFYRGTQSGGKHQMTCASCHSGVFQTDQNFHAIAMPQIGAGKGDGFDGHEDFGRERVTQDIADRYKFRTPSLRNIALTAPYGHAGAYNSLQAVVEHHMDAINALFNYDQSQAVLPSRSDLDANDFIVMDDAARLTDIANASELTGFGYKDKHVKYLIDFLHALTDPSSIDLRDDVPKSVPSGLSLAE